MRFDEVIYTRAQLVLKAEAEALKQEIDPALICAVVDQLSSWNPAKTEVIGDEGFNPAIVYPTAEDAALASCRIGLMQFTGKQARQLGYKENLDGLLEPDRNLEIGIILLKNALAATGKQFDRSLVVVYGYSIVASIRRILGKIRQYQAFLSSPARPNPTIGENDGVYSVKQ